MPTISIHGSNNESNLILSSENASITSDESKAKSNEVVPSEIVLNPRLPKFVKLLAEDSTALDSYLSNPFIKYSTWNMTNMYVEGDYYQLGLLAWLNKEISTYTGPTCPGISNVEMIAQQVITVKDTPAAPANPAMGLNGKNGAIQVVPFNPSWNVLDENFQNALTIMDTILCFEENLGIHHSGMVSNSTLKTLGSNRVLHLDFNADVYKQFVPGSFMLQPEVLKAAAINPDNSNVLLPTDAEASQIIATIDSELNKSFEKMQFGIKVSNESGTFGAVNDVLGSIIKVLARGHLSTATLARKIRENPNLPLQNMSGHEGGNFLFAVAGWIPGSYYMDPMLADANHFAEGSGNYLGSGGVMPVLGSMWSPAVKAGAYEKLKSIYGIEKSNMTGGAVKTEQGVPTPWEADGFTLTVPTTNMNANLSNALNTLPFNIPVGNTLVK